VQKSGKSKRKTFTVVILFFFDSNKTHLVLQKRTRQVVSAVGSNNAGVWGGAPDVATIFAVFLNGFLSLFWSKFCLKMRFK